MSSAFVCNALFSSVGSALSQQRVNILVLVYSRLTNPVALMKQCGLSIVAVWTLLWRTHFVKLNFARMELLTKH